MSNIGVDIAIVVPAPASYPIIRGLGSIKMDELVAAKTIFNILKSRRQSMRN